MKPNRSVAHIVNQKEIVNIFLQLSALANNLVTLK